MEDPFQTDQAPVQSFSSSNSKKMKKLTSWIILVGVFILAVQYLFLYFYYQRLTTDNLFELVPIDTVVYTSARQSVWPWRKTSLSLLPFKQFYDHLDSDIVFSDIDLKNILLDNSKQAALAITLDQNNNLDWIYFFELKDASLIIPFLISLPNNLILDGHILVVSLNKSALDKIEQVYNKQIFSLDTQIDRDKLQSGQARFYLSAKNFKSFLKQSDRVLDQVFSNFFTRDIYLNLDQQQDYWQLSYDQSLFGSAQLENSNPAIYLPDDFSFFGSNINLFSFFNNLAMSESSIIENFGQVAEIFKAAYEFELTEVSDNFLKQPADLILFDNQIDNFLGFDFVLVLPPVSTEQLSQFEELARIVLAQKLPVKVKRFLSDGTSVIELIANVDAWRWEDHDENNDLNIRFLVEPEVNFELSYFIGQNQLVISSSAGILEDFITQQSQSFGQLPIHYLAKCDMDLGAQVSQSYLIFNNQHILQDFSDFMPDGLSILGEKRGCILGN